MRAHALDWHRHLRHIRLKRFSIPARCVPTRVPTRLTARPQLPCAGAPAAGVPPSELVRRIGFASTLAARPDASNDGSPGASSSAMGCVPAINSAEYASIVGHTGGAELLEEFEPPLVRNDHRTIRSFG
jgi:hypothetical protein